MDSMKRCTVIPWGILNMCVHFQIFRLKVKLDYTELPVAFMEFSETLYSDPLRDPQQVCSFPGPLVKGQR